jgi:hypothetical protein
LSVCLIKKMKIYGGVDELIFLTWAIVGCTGSMLYQFMSPPPNGNLNICSDNRHSYYYGTIIILFEIPLITLVTFLHVWSSVRQHHHFLCIKILYQCSTYCSDWKVSQPGRPLHWDKTDKDTAGEEIMWTPRHTLQNTRNTGMKSYPCKRPRRPMGCKVLKLPHF